MKETLKEEMARYGTGPPFSAKNVCKRIVSPIIKSEKGKNIREENRLVK